MLCFRQWWSQASLTPHTPIAFTNVSETASAKLNKPSTDRLFSASSAADASNNLQLHAHQGDTVFSNLSSGASSACPSSVSYSFKASQLLDYRQALVESCREGGKAVAQSADRGLCPEEILVCRGRKVR